MRNHSGWSVRLTLGLLGVLLLILTACDPVDEGTPAPIATEGQVVLNLPTRTLPPIVSETPRFTATPIPSLTFTPSITPTPTLTAVPPTLTLTPTPTLTPTVSGKVRSVENVNLREGPGIDYDIVATAPPGTDIGVIGIQTDEKGNDWFKVAYTDDEGEILTVWVLAALVDTDYRTIVGLVTPEPGTETTPRPAATRAPERVEILAYCVQKGAPVPRPTTNDNVFIEWSWYVRQEDLMDQHLEHATYEVLLDGEPLDNWER
ncbi:MAG: SH3 domain-containing protein, partial [Anaerolineae bacterium]|nr:SH3 domain-containing protein [Anaerolineae bacterium]